MRMVLTSDAKVYGRELRAGDEFDCPEKECKLWAALARAERVGIEASGGELPLVGEKADDQAESQGRRGRQGRYNRRDMRAEG